ncbi:MAG TPA: hypothetical protein VGR26_07895 [Acidimicrobiales bacterium]|nr:hypothetical protein [Acidimicrobiales bacterium]
MNGQEIKELRITPPEDPSAIAECPKCNGRWFIFEDANQIEVSEGARESEVAYSEEFVLDNSRGVSSLRTTKTVAYEWSQVLEISVETTSANESSVKFGGDIASLNVMAQNAIKTTYKLSEEKSRTYSNEFTFDVPAGVRRRVIMTFKRVWQHGHLILKSADGSDSQIPFKVVVALDFDNITQDDARH